MKRVKMKLSAYWKCQLIGWTLYASIPLVFYLSTLPSLYVEPGTPESDVRQSFPLEYVWMSSGIILIGIFLSHLMKIVARKAAILQKSFVIQVCAFFVLSLLTSVIFLLAVNTWATGPRYISRLYLVDRYSLFMQVIIFWGAFMIWSLIYFLYHYVKRVRNEEKEKYSMSIKMLELEAKALRSQMNPHFVFNSLNSIKSLIRQHEEEKAVEYLTTFSKLIRTLLINADKREVTLYDELETCKLYLQLEAMRFGPRLQYKVELDEGIDQKSILVPAMIIQPFIENAIWHGILPKETGGVILIHIGKKNKDLFITVDDDGIGREASMRNKDTTLMLHKSKGVHLTQVRLQLESYLTDKSLSLEIIDKKSNESASKGTRVVVSIAQQFIC